MQALSQLSYTPGKRRRIILSAIFPVNVQVEVYHPHHPLTGHSATIDPFALLVLTALPPARPVSLRPFRQAQDMLEGESGKGNDGRMGSWNIPGV